MPFRSAVATIPDHLKPFIAHQDSSLYTPIDHASWRFILRISRAFFTKNAHPKYLAGLQETGISSERIPLVDEMDAKLKRFGWRAVPVSGFIPPAAFMEFQSLGILPIACEMRTLDHLAYTPAPDIVHEAAGHAPILADPEYASYLRCYGEIARKAIFSSKDMEVYEAIRLLSDIKENPKSTAAEIDGAQVRLDQALAGVDYLSEATLLARMNWWTVEYGLVGSVDNPKIYGAGLLSSVGESFNCLKPAVQKIPFSLSCINVNYDITRPQPQLFITPDFPALSEVLEEFAYKMAFRQGGVEGLDKAKRAATVTTVQLESGLQLSGVVERFIVSRKGDVEFLKLAGPSQLAIADHELEGHGPSYHSQGYSTPLGPIAGLGKTVAELSRKELEGLGFTGSSVGTLEFASGIVLQGVLKSCVERDGNIRVATFDQCRIARGNEIFYRPEWGTFDLAAGSVVASVFGGAADRGAYLRGTGGFKQKPQHPKCNLTDENRELNQLYAQVRAVREDAAASAETEKTLSKIHAELERQFPEDWLLRLELLELVRKSKLQPIWESTLLDRLHDIADSRQDKKEMITRGLELL